MLPKATLSVPVGKLPSSFIVPPSTERLPSTVRPSVTAVPVTSIPELVVASFCEPAKCISTAPPLLAFIVASEPSAFANLKLFALIYRSPVPASSI